MAVAVFSCTASAEQIDRLQASRLPIGGVSGGGVVGAVSYTT